MACPGSAHLTQHDYHTTYADQGNDRHGDAEAAAVLGANEDLPWQVRKLLEPGDVLSAECAMAIDTSDDTARALGHIAWRDYTGLRPFEIPGTIDLIVYGERRILVVDYKGFERVTSAADNQQLACAALAVARAAGRDEVTVAIVYLGASWLSADIATLGMFELDAHSARLRDMMISTDKTLRPGPHCKYCHAFLSCPEQKALAIQAGTGEIAVRVESMIPFQDDSEAAEAYELLQRIKIVVSRLNAALHARAAERPIQLRSGKLFGPHHKLGNEKLDGDVVYETVKRLHDQTTADAAVARVATKKRLDAALKGKRGAAKAVIEAVRAAGGAERKTTTTIEEYDSKLQLVADDDDPPPALADSPF